MYAGSVLPFVPNIHTNNKINRKSWISQNVAVSHYDQQSLSARLSLGFRAQHDAVPREGRGWINLAQNVACQAIEPLTWRESGVVHEKKELLLAGSALEPLGQAEPSAF